MTFEFLLQEESYGHLGERSACPVPTPLHLPAGPFRNLVPPSRTGEVGTVTQAPGSVSGLPGNQRWDSFTFLLPCVIRWSGQKLEN